MAVASDQQSKCVLDYLDVGKGGTCEIQTKTCEGFTFVLTTKDLEYEYNQIFHSQFMTDTCKNITSCESFRPCEDTLVVVDSNGQQRRGRVVSVLDNNMYRIALFDTCSVQTVEKSKLKMLPLQCTTIPQFGVRAIIGLPDRFNLKKVIKPGMKFTLLVTAREGNHATAELAHLHVDGDIKFEASVLPWLPNYEDTGLKCIKLVNKSEVQIVSYCGQHDIYLCPTDDENVDLRLGVCNDVAAYCVKAPVMEYLPDQCEIVASRFTKDDVYHRALVLTREDGRVQVSYLDYGNIEYVTLDRLKPLPDHFKLIPKTAVHVRLKDVMHCPLTTRAMRFIDLMILSDAKMIVTFTNSYSDGVNLVTVESRENVNRMVNDCLTPYWKLAAVAGTPLYGEEVFFARDIGFLSLPEAQTFKLFVSHKETHSKFFGCIDNRMSAYILQGLPKEILPYCNALNDVCYTPRTNELCLALWEDEWCRALCLRVKQNGCAVYFIDWGHTDILTLNFIRRMPKDFVDFPSIANVCFIHGLPTNPSDGLQKRLEELIPEYSSHKATVMSRKKDKYYLSLPDIMDTLLREGFLSTNDSRT